MVAKWEILKNCLGWFEAKWEKVIENWLIMGAKWENDIKRDQRTD
jgi:hypothetical protein